ncbi:hypothetical protein KDL29_00060 [bacterium]|nr:hypothetical protein [bacterium]
MTTTTHSAEWLDLQLDEVELLQQRTRTVVLDDLLEQLEQITDEKHSRLSGIDPLRVPADLRERIGARLSSILSEEHSLENLVQDRMMLMRNQLKKASSAGRALKGYAAGTGMQKGIGSASRDLNC